MEKQREEGQVERLRIECGELNLELEALVCYTLIQCNLVIIIIIIIIMLVVMMMVMIMNRIVLVMLYEQLFYFWCPL